MVWGQLLCVSWSPQHFQVTLFSKFQLLYLHSSFCDFCKGQRASVLSSELHSQAPSTQLVPAKFLNPLLHDQTGLVFISSQQEAYLRTLTGVYLLTRDLLFVGTVCLSLTGIN